MSKRQAAGDYPLPWGDAFEKYSDEQREREVQNRLKEKIEKDDWLYCVNCSAVITHARERMAMQGAHSHRMTNPLGFTFYIGCFHNAPGCTHIGEETAEHTWFPGYAWRIALCSGCGSHLGWRFRGPDGQFHGLILSQLVSRAA